MTTLDDDQKKSMITQITENSLEKANIQTDVIYQKDEAVLPEPIEVTKTDPMEIKMFDISNMNQKFIESSYIGKKQDYFYGTIDNKTGYILDENCKNKEDSKTLSYPNSTKVDKQNLQSSNIISSNTPLDIKETYKDLPKQESIVKRTDILSPKPTTSTMFNQG